MTKETFFKRQVAKMTAYEADLTYDRTEMDKYPGVPFIHVQRGTGTSMTMMHTIRSFPITNNLPVPYLFGHANRTHIVKDQADCLINFYQHETPLQITHYDGKDFHTISYEKMASLLREWKERLTIAFRRPA